MYVPEAFRLDDAQEAAALMRRYNFALLVTAAGGAPSATHLPFLFDSARGPRGTLVGHLARANPQGRDLARLETGGNEALVVFQGPHGYVSPTWYGGGPAVPTWNYLAVHAYGVPKVVAEAEAVRAILDRLVAAHEAGFDEPWSLDSQEPRTIAALMRAIVAFEIPIARLETKAKLNQNKDLAARRGVIAGLEATGGPLERELAARMRGRVLSD